MEIKVQAITDIEHPQDGIGSAGIDEVKNMLIKEGIIDYYYEFERVLEDIGSEWIVKKGKYAGTFPKRLAKSIKARHKVKINPTVLGNLGELAKRHTVEAMGYKLDFTATFNWKDGDFGDESSCFWGDHRGALDMICDSGGLAVRFYDEDGYGYGRAWMLPYGKHWVIFNAYGKNLTTITVARILATEMGWSYKRIRLTNEGSYDGTLWINGGLAYLIGETGKIEDTDNVDLDIPDTGCRGEYRCEHCDDYMDDYYCVQDCYYCYHCYDDLFFYCEHCGNDEWSNHAMDVWIWSGGRYHLHDWCEGCAENGDANECYKCGKAVNDWHIIGDECVCNECVLNLERCEDCDAYALMPHTHIDYPRNTNGTFANRVATLRCHDCHFHGSWREEE